MATRSADARFSSRWTLLLSVLGIAVGTGNIWRFPRIAAKTGGEEGAGAFLVAWLVFLVAWSLPLIVAEYALGQRGRKGVVGTVAALAGPRLAWMGAFVAFVAAAIMCYYSVVAGWCLYYTGGALVSGLPLTLDGAQASWDAFQASGLPVALHAVMMGTAAVVCLRGVSSIERVNRVLVPTLLAIVVVAVVRAVTLPGAGAGVAYLFTPDWSVLASPAVWLEALTQNAWDTGAGWGLILTYAAYMRREDGIVRNAVLTGVGNNLVSLLAATMVFGIVFAVLGAQRAPAEVLDVMRTSGPAGTGITFIWMPQLFAAMPLGKPLAVAFFLALTFAALSSLISMVELTSRVVVDFGVARRRAVPAVGVAAFAVGVPSAVWGGVFANQDFVWGVALVISGAFVAFAVTRYGAGRLMSEVSTPSDWPLPRVWGAWLKWAIPVQAAVLLGWWLWQATTADFTARWWDPTEPFSAATCLLQWGLALAVFLTFNRWMARRTGALEPPRPAPPGA
ncbi:sodium-dependent transporter [Rubrivirga litoralis]|uniref:Sodium-dependent transporter n=1 Tax=Rubrivirga litoralis TaxID=3075598 RepID=A0ABU3BTA9_9BACT|nr:sodium-dependent transporter [Rubrivirga sp. F394]MDT0632524.1 sodium-dependent transporter [Rubrivirga sp. F394]